MLTRLTAIALLCIPGVYAHSAEGDHRWYAAVKASLGDVTLSDIETRNIGTGQLIGGIIDGQLEDDEIDDYTAGLGVAIGKRMGNWAIEGELVWRYRTDWDIVTSTPSIETITNVFSNVETTSLLVNAIRRGSLSRNWSWEVGAGIGVVTNNVESEYLERATLTNPQLQFKDDSRHTDFSYNILAGVTRGMSGPGTFNIRYRYIDLGDLETGPFPTRPGSASAEQTAHEIQFSLERDFR